MSLQLRFGDGAIDYFKSLVRYNVNRPPPRPIPAPAKFSPRFHLYFIRVICRTSDTEAVLRTYAFMEGKYLNVSKQTQLKRVHFNHSSEARDLWKFL